MPEHSATDADIFDLVVLGGGINGTGIARDGAGRGLSVVLLERDDLAAATSSQSSKLVHGGLRYLEFYEFALVRKALLERELAFRASPHLARPIPFLLPAMQQARPRWMIRAGLFLYDHLARHPEVPNSRRVALQKDAAGPAFRREITQAFRYWDGAVDDSRLVVSVARDAAMRGAHIHPREAATSAQRTDFGWLIRTSRGREIACRMLVNCTGPWAEQVARDLLGVADPPRLSLVQGAHLLIRRINRTDDAWTLQQPDGRIVFVIPYEHDFSLIGTTETPVQSPEQPTITTSEERYLLEAVNRSLMKPISGADIVHRFAGIRPLVLEDGKDARETTRDWRLVRHDSMPALTVVGGKITTYRRLAEAVIDKLFPKTKRWTAHAVLPGGDMPRATGSAHGDYARWLQHAIASRPDYDPAIITRMARLYGTECEAMLDQGLGASLGGIFEAELQHMHDQEWARSAEDALWRRSKLGLVLDAGAQQRVAQFFERL